MTGALAPPLDHPRAMAIATVQVDPTDLQRTAMYRASTAVDPPHPGPAALARCQVPAVMVGQLVQVACDLPNRLHLAPLVVV